MSAIIDNRVKGLKGEISQMSDIDDCFRALVANHEGWNMGKAKAFTKVYSGKVIYLKNLFLLAVELDCKFSVDPIADEFKVFFAERGKKVLEIDDTPDAEEVVKTDYQEPKFKEVKPSIDPELIIGDDESDLF